MKAVRNLGGRVEVRQVDLTGPEDWPVIQVAAAGICSSDLHLLAGGPSAITPGHEFAGWTDDGEAVAVLPLIGCGSCNSCAGGNPQLCTTQIGFLGVTVDGGMADRVRAPRHCLRPLPPGLAPDDACLAEPLAVALHGLHRAGVGPDDRVLVVGAGPIGLGAIAAAVELGASVDVADLRPERLDRAAALGAGTDQGQDYDVVVDAAGSQGALDAAVRRCAPGGTVALIATHWSPVQMGIELQLKEVSLVPAYLYGEHRGELEFDQALRILATTELADVAVSHRVGLTSAAEAFELAATDPAAAKVVLVP